MLPRLSRYEADLMDCAVSHAWTPELREALARAVRGRGGIVATYDNCGDLVEELQRVANA